MAAAANVPRPKNNLPAHLKWVKDNHSNKPPNIELYKAVTAAPKVSNAQTSSSRNLQQLREVPMNILPDPHTKSKDVTPMRPPVAKNSAQTVDLTLSSPPISPEKTIVRQSSQLNDNFFPPSMKGITPIPMRMPGTQRQLADQISSSLTRVNSTRHEEEGVMLPVDLEVEEEEEIDDESQEFASSPECISNADFPNLNSDLDDRENVLVEAVTDAAFNRPLPVSEEDSSTGDFDGAVGSTNNRNDFGTHLLHLNNCKRMISLLREQLEIKDKILDHYSYNATQSISGINTGRLLELQGEIDTLDGTMNFSENQAVSHDNLVAFSQDATSSARTKRVLKEIVLDEDDFMFSDQDEGAGDDSKREHEGDIGDSSDVEIVDHDSEFDDEDNRALDEAFNQRGPAERSSGETVGESVRISESDFEDDKQRHEWLENEVRDLGSSDSDFGAVERFIDNRNESCNQSFVDISMLSDDEDHCPPVLTQPSNNQDAYPYYSGDGFPWDEEVLKTLHDVFKLPGFRFNQKQAINATLDGRDVLVLMPTGGGKSLCYQLPALVAGKSSGVTIVISPLISLMMDQVEQLHQKGVTNVEYLSAAIAKSRRSTILSLLANGRLDVLYLAPEAIDGIARSLEELHENKQIARIVIDEAHCMSSWGHDFREHYLKLKDLKTLYPGVPIMALTATATPAVQEDIKTCLRRDPEPLVLKQSFNRTNLYYEVRQKTRGVMTEMADLIKSKFHNQTGIVYCFSRKDAENTAEGLRNCGIRAGFYHANIDPEMKDAAQRDWQSGRTKVVCATIAFGMGIDKPDVRFVIHKTLPKTLEGYYQETGRAGRDGKQSVCILYFSEGDVVSMRDFISKTRDLPNSRKVVLEKMLAQVSGYCRNRVDCRRAQVLQYFNETFDAKNCNGNCDNCRNRSKGSVSDQTAHAKSLARLVKHVEKENVTALSIATLYQGKSVKKITKFSCSTIPGFGLGKNLSNDRCRMLVDQMIAQEYLALRISVKGRFRNEYIAIGSKLSQLLTGGAKFLVHEDAPQEHEDGPSNAKRRKVTSEAAPATSNRRSSTTSKATNSRSPYFNSSNTAASRRRAGRPAASASRASTASYSKGSRGKTSRSTGRRQTASAPKTSGRTASMPVMQL